MDKHIKPRKDSIMGKPEQLGLMRQASKFICKKIKDQRRECVGNNYEQVAYWRSAKQNSLDFNLKITVPAIYYMC